MPAGFDVCIGSPARFHMFDLAQQVQQRGLLRRLFTAYPRWKVEGGLPADRIRSFPWVLPWALAADRWRMRRVARALNRQAIVTFDRWMASQLPECDIVHCISGAGLATYRTAKARFAAKTLCDRGSTHIEYQDELLAEEHARWHVPYDRIDPVIVERELQEYEECDRIVVPSRMVSSSFVRKGTSPSKIVQIGYGVDLRLFRPVPKENATFRVIYVGALSLRKGIPYLLEALAPLPHVELWLVGAVQPEVRRFLAMYPGRYRYFGVQPRTELYRLYSQASVFVLPSIEEGLALVQAQAMACGLPVIATTHTGAEDLFADGVEGFIVPIRDPQAIREKVERLCTDPALRDAMAERARLRVQQMGGWDTYGSRMIACYRDLLAERPAHAHARPPR